MGLVRLDAGGVAWDGDIGSEDVDGFEHALDTLRRNPQVKAPLVDLSKVHHMPSSAIGALVTLWIDLINEGRWFELRASDAAWRLFEKAGIARVFFHRPEDGAGPSADAR